MFMRWLLFMFFENQYNLNIRPSAMFGYQWRLTAKNIQMFNPPNKYCQEYIAYVFKFISLL